MSAPFHERFASELAKALPEDFDLHVDTSLASARYQGASLLGFVPRPADRRKPVADEQVTRWIQQATASLRRLIPNYTPAAQESSKLLLARLEEWQEAQG